MRPRTAVILKNGVPGPGQYSPSKQSILTRPPSAVIGSGQRGENFMTSAKAPGPGAYLQAVNAKRGPSYTFGISRPNSAKESVVPGPGSYKVPVTFNQLPRYTGMKFEAI